MFVGKSPGSLKKKKLLNFQKLFCWETLDEHFLIIWALLLFQEMMHPNVLSFFVWYTLCPFIPVMFVGIRAQSRGAGPEVVNSRSWSLLRVLTLNSWRPVWSSNVWVPVSCISSVRVSRPCDGNSLYSSCSSPAVLSVCVGASGTSVWQLRCRSCRPVTHYNFILTTGRNIYPLRENWELSCFFSSSSSFKRFWTSLTIASLINNFLLT